MQTVVDPGVVILERIARNEVERARLEAKISADMLEFEDLRRLESQWTPDMRLRRMEMGFAAEELGAVLRQPGQAVQVRLFEARRVRGLLPGTWLAHLRGEIDAWRVKLISSTAGNLVEPGSLVTLDSKVVAYAARHTGSQTKAWLRRFVAKVEAGHQVERTRRGLADRAVWVEHHDDGFSWLHAMMPTVDAVRIDQALTHRAKLLPSDSRTPDTRTLQNVRADLLADLLVDRNGTGTGTGTGTGRAGAVIAITIPVTSLAGVTDEPGISFDGQFALPADLIRDLATEPGTLFHRVITDPLGHILDVTEIGRFPSPKLRIAIQARDGTCHVATCSRPATDCDLDHQQPHPQGPTTGDNLQPLCRKHHRMKTHLTTNPTTLTMSRPQPTRLEHDLATWTINWEYAA